MTCFTFGKGELKIWNHFHVETQKSDENYFKLSPGNTRTLAFRCGPDLPGRLAGTDFTKMVKFTRRCPLVIVMMILP